MDAQQILNLLNDSLSDLGADITVFNENQEILRLEVVSPQFKGVKLYERIKLVTDRILSLSQNELSDYEIVVNPLTKNEKEFGVSETTQSKEKKNNSGLAASSNHI